MIKAIRKIELSLNHNYKISKKFLLKTAKKACSNRIKTIRTYKKLLKAGKKQGENTLKTAILKVFLNRCIQKIPVKKKGFFGYGKNKNSNRGGDIFCQNMDCIIELKYLRKTAKNKTGKYEIRNALGQTLENAIVSDLKNAILLIWDEAYSKENWDKKSEKFISMFINNPFGINFAVIRIRVYENHCTADIYL